MPCKLAVHSFNSWNHWSPRGSMVAASCTLLFASLGLVGLSVAMGPRFDWRGALSTKTRYAWRTRIPGAPSLYSTPDPPGHQPVHMWLLARHGSRWPTANRMNQINSLEGLFKDARNAEQHPWVRDWRSPVHDMLMAAGDLHPIGEDEMWGLARRLRSRYPTLAAAQYYPRRYSFVSTQVPRTSASASAFASGFFPGVTPGHEESRDLEHAHAAIRAMNGGGGGPGCDAASSSDSSRASGGSASTSTSSRSTGGSSWQCDWSPPEDEVLSSASGRRHARAQAVAVTMAPKRQDPLLRFYDTCPLYEVHEDTTDAWLDSWMASNWTWLAPRLEARLGMTRPIEPCEVQGLWQLCLLEAGLHNDTSRACSLFTPEEASLFEWMDDVKLYEGHGYGAAINYQIAAPLLADLRTTLKSIAAEPQPTQRARLLFAHCETLVPLAALMGLFKETLVAGAAATDAAAGWSWEQGPTGTGSGLGLLGQDAELRRQVERSLEPQQSSSGTCYKRKRPGETPPPAGWAPSVPFVEQRLWRGSRIGPYSGNLAVVLYRATGGGSSSSSSHKVRLVYNEQVLSFPGCDLDGQGQDCDLEEFLERSAHLVDLGAMNRTCTEREGEAGGNTTAAAA